VTSPLLIVSFAAITRIVTLATSVASFAATVPPCCFYCSVQLCRPRLSSNDPLRISLYNNRRLRNLSLTNERPSQTYAYCHNYLVFRSAVFSAIRTVAATQFLLLHSSVLIVPRPANANQHLASAQHPSSTQQFMANLFSLQRHLQPQSCSGSNLKIRSCLYFSLHSGLDLTSQTIAAFSFTATLTQAQQLLSTYSLSLYQDSQNQLSTTSLLQPPSR
jgi:hypothetical protein